MPRITQNELNWAALGYLRTSSLTVTSPHLYLAINEVLRPNLELLLGAQSSPPRFMYDFVREGIRIRLGKQGANMGKYLRQRFGGGVIGDILMMGSSVDMFNLTANEDRSTVDGITADMVEIILKASSRASMNYRLLTGKDMGKQLRMLLSAGMRVTDRVSVDLERDQPEVFLSTYNAPELELSCQGDWTLLPLNPETYYMENWRGAARAVLQMSLFDLLNGQRGFWLELGSEKAQGALAFCLKSGKVW